MLTSRFEGLIRYSRMAGIHSWLWICFSPSFIHCCFNECNAAITIRWPNILFYIVVIFSWILRAFYSACQSICLKTTWQNSCACNIRLKFCMLNYIFINVCQIILEQFREYLIKTVHGTAICLIWPICADKLPMSGHGLVGWARHFLYISDKFYHLTL